MFPKDFRIRDLNSMSREKSWLQTGATHYYALPGQRPCNQTVGCLLCSMASIYDQWDRSLEEYEVLGSGPLLWS